MTIEVLKSKIHRVTVTEANLNYVGSVTIDEELLEAANILAGEKVQIVNVNNGERIETYAIRGERGRGQVCLNGAAARKAAVGDVESSSPTPRWISRRRKSSHRGWSFPIRLPTV